MQRHGHALSSSDADRTRGPVTVSDHLQALMGVSKVRSGRSPGLDGKYTRPFLPAGGRQFHLLGLGRSCSTRLRCLGYFSPRVAFQGMQEALGKVCYVRPSIKSCLRAGISGSYCLALRQGSLFYFGLRSSSIPSGFQCLVCTVSLCPEVGVQSWFVLGFRGRDHSSSEMAHKVVPGESRTLATPT